MDSKNDNTINNFDFYFRQLEKRIARIEKYLQLDQIDSEKEEHQKLLPVRKKETADTLELRIGQFWFARTGIVVLALGIAFLLTLPFKEFPPIVPSLFGFLIVAGIFAISLIKHKSIDYLTPYFLGGSLVLLYFATLRLHFFGEQSVISDKFLELILLMVVVFLSLFVSVSKKSVYISHISLFLGYFSAILLGQDLSIFTIITLMAIVALILKHRYHWNSLFIFAIILSFFTHLNWFLNNPFQGHRMVLVNQPYSNLLFVILYIIIFTLGNLLRKKEQAEDGSTIISTFLLSFLGYGLYLLLTITTFNKYLFLSHFTASILFLIVAAIFWLRQSSQYSTFFYAILGYSALSVSIIVQFKSPDFFLWLSLQSLLVISTAIWFRSKFIVMANFIIFLIIFLTFIYMSGESGWIGLNFGAVALLSARIMNWKRHRLDLKTEFMRNAYLTTSFFIIPYALYQIVPTSLVSLSWIITALIYYALSIILKNNKYRWMALLTLLLTILYLFIIGMIKLEAGYRIVSFIFLGLVLLIVSILYARFRIKSQGENIQQEEK
jgi:hypothetical protein